MEILSYLVHLKQKSYRTGRNIISSINFVLILALIFSSCGKDKSDKKEAEQLPVFGTCKAVKAKGKLSQSTVDSTFTYLTSGGGKIFIDRFVITLSHKDYTNFKIEFWGNLFRKEGEVFSVNHENLNGKHIKDREGDRRSIIFPDGAKITMSSSGLESHSLTIYDGTQCHHFNFLCKTLEYSSSNSIFTKRLDDSEADGETGTFEITPTGLLFYNIYNEMEVGHKVENHVPLGEIFIDEPKQTKDYYDDPRLKNT